MQQLTIGILAHVDAGKTTLSEAMLHLCGVTEQMGRVDHKTAFLDTHELERARKITIFSKQAVMSYRDTAITLLDTPGHTDFSGEMERTLAILDCAILVISASNGVQGHTRTAWNLLQKHEIPTFLFVNKMDLPDCDEGTLLALLQKELDPAILSFQADTVQEELSLLHEAALEEYLAHNTLSRHTISAMVARRIAFPCFFGSALKNRGIDTLLNGISSYMPSPLYEETFGAKVFKISYDPKGTRLTWLKITGGQASVKDAIKTQPHHNAAEKIDQIRIYSGEKFTAVPTATAGTVCALTGLSHTYAGQGLGSQKDSLGTTLSPVLSYQMILPEDCDPIVALKTLSPLAEEDPQLSLSWNHETKQMRLNLMGVMQTEILQEMIAARFGLSVRFDSGSILYLETIQSPVAGVGHFEPLRHYAEVQLLLEPLPLGSGIVLETALDEYTLSGSFQRLILTHLAEKQHLGVLTASPITDMRITLVGALAHAKHTEGGDFRQATYRALRQGLRSAESVLLQPYLSFELSVPTSCVGRAMTDLQRMHAQFDGPFADNDASILKGVAPVSALANYGAELSAYTGGMGRLNSTPCGYRPCENQDEIVAAIGYQCDRDTENTADSVFFSHGSGFTVKWDKVSEYMHLPPYFKKEITDTPAATAAPRAQKTPLARGIEGDKQLQEIYERTYGKSRRYDFRPRSEIAPWEQDLLDQQRQRKFGGVEYLLVDGYNIIFANPQLKRMADTHLDDAREKLINILCNYQGFRRCEVILVFDAYRIGKEKETIVKHENITVVYTKKAQTADNYIEKATYLLGKEHQVRVATSDYTEQIIILNHGASRLSASAFWDEMEKVNQRIASVMQGQNLRPHATRPIAHAMEHAKQKKDEEKNT